ncbi:MAG: SdrD B-like domain-containing protein [Verrucomicrobiota bacterium]
MKTPAFAIFTSFWKWSLMVLAVGAAAFTTPSARADEVPGAVSYSPGGRSYDGFLPLIATYSLSITSPSTHTAGVTSNVTFDVQSTAAPLGIPAFIARGFVTISPSTVTFTGPGQVQTVTVSINIPATVGGLFAYQVYTRNWAAGFTYSDQGTSIGASMSMPTGGGGGPPVVTIDTPLDGAIIDLPLGTTFPTTVPLVYTVTAPAGSPINTSDADLGGIPLSVSLTGIGTVDVDGTASVSVPAAGTYTVRARGSNASGTSQDTATFTVRVASTPPPPVVTITAPVDGSETTVSAGSLPMMVNFAFTAESTGVNKAPITAISAQFMSTAVSLTNIQGLNTFNVSAQGQLRVDRADTYTVTAYATNAGGQASDVTTFLIKVVAAPPTVVINSPVAPNNVYTYRHGGAAVQVPYTFTAKSNAGGLRTLVAKIDGVTVHTETFTAPYPMTVTRTVNRTYTPTATVTYPLTVTATDDQPTAANATGSFTINYVAPTPAIDITSPAENAIFNIPSGQSSTSVSYRFVTTSNNGFFVDSVTAIIGTTPVTNITTTGLGTASAISTGTLTGLTPGTYTLTANGLSAGISVSDTVRFTVRAAASVPPSVVINTPAPNATFTRVSGGPALSIPLTFTGTSNTPGGVITQLKASLGSTTLSVTPTNLGQRVATGAATMSVTNAGTYTITVTAIDAYGVANATSKFTVCVVQGKNICGEIFFDVDSDGTEDCDEFGLSNITIKLLNSSGQVIATDVTDNCGDYSFCNIGPGNYTVTATGPAGLKATTTSSRTVTVSNANVCVPRMGFGLNFIALRALKANGNSHGFWKANIDKAISGKTSGMQVSKSALVCYTENISDFALSPYDCFSLKTASSILGSTSSRSTDLLSKQLVASEYNYQHAAYINGDRTLTFLFLYWGEYVLKNSSRYSTSYVLWTKDWFDAYNNSHGGVVAGPAP